MCLLTDDSNNKPSHNTTTYCVYWRTTTTIGISLLSKIGGAGACTHMYLVISTHTKLLIEFLWNFTVLVHNLQMCMKEYRCCLKFRRADNSTYTFTKRGSCTLYAQLLLNGLLEFCETLHSCSTLPADEHEGIWLRSKI